MTYEEIYFKVMGHSPNKEHGVQGAFTWSDIESLMQEAVKNYAVLPHVSNPLSCDNCRYENSKYDKYCNDCINFSKYEKAI
jgi:hypothetical protein